jgi:hypothetical protein
VVESRPRITLCSGGDQSDPVAHGDRRRRGSRRRDQLESTRRQPEIEILGIRATGGGGLYVTFPVELQNTGTKLARARVSTFVGDTAVRVHPEAVDLLVNVPPSTVEVGVPRPQLGQLMPECGHETTLYNETLRVRVEAEGESVEATWHEHVYDENENRARYEVQQGYWRRGRGKETPDDERADAVREHEERVERGEDDESRYTHV